MNYIIYPTYNDLIEKHDEVIRKSGGAVGVFNENLLQSLFKITAITQVLKKNLPI